MMRHLLMGHEHLCLQSVGALMGLNFCNDLQCIGQSNAFHNATFQRDCINNATRSGRCSNACLESLRRLDPHCRATLQLSVGPAMQESQMYVGQCRWVLNTTMAAGSCSSTCATCSKHPTLQPQPRYCMLHGVDSFQSIQFTGLTGRAGYHDCEHGSGARRALPVVMTRRHGSRVAPHIHTQHMR